MLKLFWRSPNNQNLAGYFFIPMGKLCIVVGLELGSAERVRPKFIKIAKSSIICIGP